MRRNAGNSAKAARLRRTGRVRYRRLARGGLDAVSEHLAPVLRATHAEYRTVPVIGRDRSLNTLLGQRPDLASSTLAALRDDLAEFCTHSAITPAGLEPGQSTSPSPPRSDE